MEFDFSRRPAQTSVRNELSSAQFKNMYGKGFSILSKMGFRGGGLGKHGDGIANPLEASFHKKNSGIGSSETGNSTSDNISDGIVEVYEPILGRVRHLLQCRIDDGHRDFASTMQTLSQLLEVSTRLETSVKEYTPSCVKIRLDEITGIRTVIEELVVSASGCASNLNLVEQIRSKISIARDSFAESREWIILDVEEVISGMVHYFISKLSKDMEMSDIQELIDILDDIALLDSDLLTLLKSLSIEWFSHTNTSQFESEQVPLFYSIFKSALEEKGRLDVYEDLFNTTVLPIVKKTLRIEMIKKYFPCFPNQDYFRRILKQNMGKLVAEGLNSDPADLKNFYCTYVQNDGLLRKSFCIELCTQIEEQLKNDKFLISLRRLENIILEWVNIIPREAMGFLLSRTILPQWLNKIREELEGNIQDYKKLYSELLLPYLDLFLTCCYAGQARRIILNGLDLILSHRHGKTNLSNKMSRELGTPVSFSAKFIKETELLGFSLSPKVPTTRVSGRLVYRIEDSRSIYWTEDGKLYVFLNGQWKSTHKSDLFRLLNNKQNS